MPLWKRRQPKAEESAAPRKRQGFAFGLASDAGRVRTSNQDHVFAMLTSLPGPNGQLTVGLFIVADGMGGHTGGAVASARAVAIVATQTLRGLIQPILEGGALEPAQDLLREATLEANRRILAEATQQHNDMGTTVTSALLLGGRCYVAHVGDSRLYSYDGRQLQRRTRDHSMVARLQELGQISAEEALHHPKRNYLYQSVGQQDEIEVEATSFSLEGCTYLLLCCDGLWGMLKDEDMARVLAAGGDAQAMADSLVAMANAAGGEDNISLVVVALPES